MNLYSISVSKNFVKVSTKLVMSNNKLICKGQDLDYIFNVLDNNVIPFTITKIK